MLVSVCIMCVCVLFFFFSSRRRHTRLQGDWSSDVCSSDLYRRWRRVPADRGRPASRRAPHAPVWPLHAPLSPSLPDSCPLVRYGSLAAPVHSALCTPTAAQLPESAGALPGLA